MRYFFVLGFILFYIHHLVSQISILSKFNGTANAGSKGELEVFITKNNINSFAKYQLEFPDGISVSDIDNQGGNFTIEGNKAKIVWINLPKEKSFTIKLKITFTEQVTFPVTLYQKFYYLENSIKKEISAEPLIIQKSESVTMEIKSSENKNENITITTSQQEYSTKPKSQKEEKKATHTATTSDIQKTSSQNNTTNNKNTSSEYTYKIQVAASPTKPDISAFSNLGKVEVMQHKGMYKVLIDKEFTSKEEALQYREQVMQKGYSGAFLVKFQNGQRVN
ncbi:MAG: hypothetical protein KatS3mg027_2320 [Bacteroidia bacterium]|nr:MAG: hypothetical protein KatS3mg027_2320 [Bacteroidia bacterium]